jgi:hypothetical protein
MDSRHLRKILEMADLNQSEAARLLDVDVRTVQRWISGDVPIPGMAETALRGLLIVEPGRKATGGAEHKHNPRRIWPYVVAGNTVTHRCACGAIFSRKASKFEQWALAKAEENSR